VAYSVCASRLYHMGTTCFDSTVSARARLVASLYRFRPYPLHFARPGQMAVDADVTVHLFSGTRTWKGGNCHVRTSTTCTLLLQRHRGAACASDCTRYSRFFFRSCDSGQHEQSRICPNGGVRMRQRCRFCITNGSKTKPIPVHPRCVALRPRKCFSRLVCFYLAFFSWGALFGFGLRLRP
jgi:hypothetical protein